MAADPAAGRVALKLMAPDQLTTFCGGIVDGRSCDNPSYTYRKVGGWELAPIVTVQFAFADAHLL